jgi:hypothetical protein
MVRANNKEAVAKAAKAKKAEKAAKEVAKKAKEAAKKAKDAGKKKGKGEASGDGKYMHFAVDGFMSSLVEADPPITADLAKFKSEYTKTSIMGKYGVCLVPGTLTQVKIPYKNCHIPNNKAISDELGMLVGLVRGVESTKEFQEEFVRTGWDAGFSGVATIVLTEEVRTCAQTKACRTTSTRSLMALIVQS